MPRDRAWRRKQLWRRLQKLRRIWWCIWNPRVYASRESTQPIFKISGELFGPTPIRLYHEHERRRRRWVNGMSSTQTAKPKFRMGRNRKPEHEGADKWHGP